jgi:hypothetical protein
MTANIIEFKGATAHRVSSVRRERAEPFTEEADAPETLSPTCKSRRLRKKRWDAWREARAVTRYWQARLDLSDAIECVQRHDAPVGRDHPAVNPGDHWPLLTSYRKALVEQLLTPAPDLAAVSWKKATHAKSQHRYVDCADLRSALLAPHVKAEQIGRLIERAIADDEAFLAAHPTRPKRKAEAEA